MYNKRVGSMIYKILVLILVALVVSRCLAYEQLGTTEDIVEQEDVVMEENSEVNPNVASIHAGCRILDIDDQTMKYCISGQTWDLTTSEVQGENGKGLVVVNIKEDAPEDIKAHEEYKYLTTRNGDNIYDYRIIREIDLSSNDDVVLVAGNYGNVVDENHLLVKWNDYAVYCYLYLTSTIVD